MKLLRLAPENTKFGFMRLRRVSYPALGVPVDRRGADVLHRRHEFRHRLRRRHAGRAARQERRRPISPTLRAKAESLGLGPVEVQRFGAPNPT